MLKRHPDVDQEARTPYSGWKDAYDDNEESEQSPCPDQVRSAQSVTGEILWLVVRSRPELSFAVRRVSQLSTKRPNDAIAIGPAVLTYLSGSADDGLLYGPASGNLGSQEHLA